MITKQSVKLDNIEDDFVVFRRYLERTEDFIYELINNLEETVIKHEDDEWTHVSLFNAITKNIHSPDETVRAQDELESAENFPYLLRESFFVMLYGYLEAFLIQEGKGHIEKNAHDKMDKAKKCLQEMGSFYQFGKSREWSKIKNYQKLRNCFVHNDGILESSEKGLYKFVTDTASLFLIGEQIALKKEFCDEVVATIEKFMIDLISAGYKET